MVKPASDEGYIVSGIFSGIFSQKKVARPKKFRAGELSV
jgi:hypothetical protein